MKYPLGAVWLVAVAAILTPVEGVQDPSQNDLSIAIVPSKGKSGSSMIDRRGVFEVVFTNRSAKPIRLWSERCQPGYDAVSFRVEDGNSQPWLMYKLPRH